ncbi:MAG TPA: TasA family protein [Thermoleophilaceae bacterium]
MTTARKVILSLLVLGLTGVAVGAVTWSAFYGTTQSSGNSFAAGTIAIGDNDAGSALLTLSNARPGDSSTRCIKVSYTGSLAASVRMYAATSGTLASHVDLVVTRGTDSSPSFPSCTGFSPDATNYVGAGAGVVYSGLLSAFPTSGTATSEPPGAPATWSSPDAHSYKFTATLRTDAPASAQGVSATADFTWEARSQ